MSGKIKLVFVPPRAKGRADSGIDGGCTHCLSVNMWIDCICRRGAAEGPVPSLWLHRLNVWIGQSVRHGGEDDEREKHA